jgi:iron complex transport system ATP-binding protein
LDLAGREAFVERLRDLAADPDAAPMVLVTHHVEEIPATFTDLLALRAGRVVRNGSLPDALDDELLSTCFDMDLTATRHDDGRWSARRRT